MPAKTPEHNIATIIRMTKLGYSIPDIAIHCRVSQRTVNRYREDYGIRRVSPPNSMSADELATAEQMLDEGCPYGEVAATLGRHHTTISKHFPGRGWPAHRGAERREMNRRLDAIYAVAK